MFESFFSKSVVSLDTFKESFCLYLALKWGRFLVEWRKIMLIENQIIQGACDETLSKMDRECIDCCVTSPPYFGLRDYGVEGQFGLEATPEEYVRKLVLTMRLVRRVLRDDGTLWLNLGDSYTNNSVPGGGDPTIKNRNVGASKYTPTKVNGLPPKNLIGIPWRVAFALQADGWYLRQDIIWHKTNPMPESVRDRCTKSHEYIFLLSKSARYHYDHEAIKEPSVKGSCGSKFNQGKTAAHQLGRSSEKSRSDNSKRNRRSVWSVPTKCFKGAHFAVFPPDLIEPCILAGCPEGGIVLDPFAGSGTTGLVAKKHNRKYLLLELNQEYIEIAEKRLSV